MGGTWKQRIATVVAGIAIAVVVLWLMVMWVEDCRENGGTLIRSSSGEMVCIEGRP